MPRLHRTLLVLLVAADVAFVVLYGLYGFKVLSDPKLGLIEDWSYGEIYQYVKEFWIVLLLATLSVRWRSPLFLAWSLLFAYLLVDDAAQLHERIGVWSADAFGFTARYGLRAVDFGEMLAAGVAGVVLLGLVGLAHWLAGSEHRSISRRLLLLLLALVFFGLGADMIPTPDVWLLEKGLGVIEDGGEHLVMSLIVWYAYVLVDSEHRSEALPDA